VEGCHGYLFIGSTMGGVIGLVGDQYFLKVHHEKLGVRHITFPKSNVLSIQRIEDRSKLAQGGQN
jgi:hypothetical protein